MLGNNGLSIFGDRYAETTLLAQVGMGAGRTYYVNNVSGSDSNNGLTWGSAYAGVSKAITESETYRALPSGSNNDFIRNTIFVQGTATAYTALSALPSHCDIVGLGAPPNGNGSGIVIIGANGADGIAGTARGLGLYNLQIQSGGDFYCMDFVNLFRSTIMDCALFAAAEATYGGMRFSASSGGVNVRHNHWGISGAHFDFHTGILIDGPSFDNNEFEGNYINAFSRGVGVASTVTQAGRTIFYNNVIGNLSGEGCAIGIYDESTLSTGKWTTTNITYAHNFISATIHFAGAGAVQKIGNMASGSATPYYINL